MNQNYPGISGNFHLSLRQLIIIMLRDAVELPESEEEFNQIYFENLLPRVFPSVSGSLNV